MAVIHRIASTIACIALSLPASSAMAQQTSGSTPAADSARRAAHAYPWRDSVRAGEGPSVGPPPSDYKPDGPPARWCLEPQGRGSGDFAVTGQPWSDASRSWLHQILADTTEWGSGWRKVLGGAPRIAPADSIVQLLDERKCHDVADVIGQAFLGWRTGPPPVVVYQVRDFLIAIPSNVRLGEWGLAIGMTDRLKLRGAATW